MLVGLKRVAQKGVSPVRLSKCNISLPNDPKKKTKFHPKNKSSSKIRNLVGGGHPFLFAISVTDFVSCGGECWGLTAQRGRERERERERREGGRKTEAAIEVLESL